MVAFVLVGAVESVTELLAMPEPAFVLKATLMPLLAAWVTARIAERGGWFHRRMLGVLFGSWVGDMALMLAPATPEDVAVLGIPKHPVWFLVGVAGFFGAHLLLITMYRRVSDPAAPGLWPRRLGWFLPLPIYAIGVGGVVVPAVLGDPERAMAAGPIALYATLLLTMLGFAIHRYGRVSGRSFGLVVGGAATFVLSDTLIGLNFLVAEAPSAVGAFAIMVTYLVAEACIAAGLLAQEGVG